MRWIFGLALLITFFTGGVAYADSPSIDDAKVFQSYETEGDWLFVVTYNISGTDTSTSLCGYTYVWWLLLKDGVTGDLLGSTTGIQCGMRPASILLNPDSVSALTWEGDYDLVLYGNWGTHPEDTYTLQDADWRGEVENEGLDDWVKWQASVIEDYDTVYIGSADYLDTVPTYGECLTPSGANIFNYGIPKLEDYRPDIFAVTHVGLNIDYVPNTDDTSYADDLYNDTEAMIGSTIYDSAEAVGDRWLGIDGRMMLALLTILGFLAIAVIEKSVAFLIIIGGVLVGFFPMGTVLLLVFLLMVTLVRALFWSST
jgi:hypothetical protein